MHKLLTRWLGKRGFNSPEELDNTPMPDGSPTERETFEQYRAILDKKELTLDNLKEFCTNQMSAIETKWADYALGEMQKAELIPYHTVYKAIRSAIDSPKHTRELIEQQLTELTK